MPLLPKNIEKPTAYLYRLWKPAIYYTLAKFAGKNLNRGQIALTIGKVTPLAGD